MSDQSPVAVLEPRAGAPPLPPTFGSVPIPAPFDIRGYRGIPLTAFTWRFWMVVVALGVYAVTLMGMVAAARAGMFDALGKDVLQFLGAIVPYGAGVFAAWLLVRSKHATLSGGLGLRPFVVASGSLAAFSGAVLARVLGVQVSLLMVQLGFDPPAAGAQFSGWTSTGLGTASLVVIAVLIAPFAEEIAFRGVLFTWLRDRWGATVALIVSSALFAAMHLDAFMFAPIFIAGIVFARLYMSTRSLWISIAAHSLFNLSGVVLYLTLRTAGLV